MRTPLVFLGALAIACLTSCPETKVQRDFGLKPAVLKSAEWEGDWASASNPHETMHFAIVSAEAGVFHAMEPAKEGKKGEVIEVVVRHQSEDKDSRLFFMTNFEKKGDAMGSINLLSKPDANLFNLWSPNNEAIEKAIAAGKLKGTIKKDKDGDHCTLTADPENYKALGNPSYWEWTKPQAFFKEPAVSISKPN